MLLLLLIALISLLVVLHLAARASLARQNLFPGALPIVGHLPLVFRAIRAGEQPHRLFARLAQQSKKGVTTLLLGTQRVTVISDAKKVRELLRHPSLNARPQSPKRNLLSFDGANIMLGNGPSWTQRRKVMMHHLSSAGMVSRFEEAIIDACDTRLRYVAALVRAGGGQQAAPTRANSTSEGVINLRVHLHRYAAEIILRMCFGDDIKALDLEALFTARDALLNFFSKPMLWDFFPWTQPLFRSTIAEGKKLRDGYVDGIRSVIDARRAAFASASSGREGGALPAPQDYLDVLVQQEVQHPETFGGKVMCSTILLDAFTAGTETSSNTLEWLLGCLLESPEALAKVQAEVDAVGDEVGNQMLAEHHTARLPYLQAALKEALRLHHVAPMTNHTASARVDLGDGTYIGAGNIITFHLDATNLDPTLFPDPQRYWPERFLPGGPNAKAGVELNTSGTGDDDYLPFGSGPRICAGYRLAQLEMKIMAANFLRCFHPAVAPGHAPDLEERFAVTVRPRGELHAVLRLRPAGVALFDAENDAAVLAQGDTLEAAARG